MLSLSCGTVIFPDGSRCACGTAPTQGVRRAGEGGASRRLPRGGGAADERDKQVDSAVEVSIDARDVERLVAEGEGPLLEFKPADARPAELATTLAALANAEGGTLIVGVRERGGWPIVEGVPNPKLTLDHLYTAAALCSPRFDLLPPERVEVAGRLVLVAVVPEGLRDAYSVEGRFVARGGSFRRALDADEIRSLLNSRGRFAYDASIVPGAARTHLDEERVRAFAARFPSGAAMDTDDLLEARQLLARSPADPAAARVPTAAGLLLLGRHPQQFLPQARVAVVRYAGPMMGERFLARELEGPIPAQLDAAEAWLAATMLRAVELKDFGRTDVDEYPLAALREIVLNALVHRDYLASGDRVRIYLFSDRCEIVSPGRLGGPMHMDNLLTERWSRNTVLVRGLAALGVMEELGFGLNRVAQQFKEEGLPPPEFQQTEGTFAVTLRGRGAQMLAEAAPQRGAGEPMLRGRAKRADRQARALDHLRTRGPLTARDYAAGQGVSEDTALRDLRDLVERGLVEARGETNNRHYVLRLDGR